MLSLAPIALIIDVAFGYPKWLQKHIAHPVTWMGAAITVFDQGLNANSARPLKRKAMGLVMLLTLVWVSIFIGNFLHQFLSAFPFGWVLEAVIASAFLAARSLHEHVTEVKEALANNLEEARAAVGRIVGRDVGALDEAGIARAGVESLAESTSDGVVAPLFWLVVAGLPGIIAYKMVSTADSMVGYKTDEYKDFGWASARADDVLNFIPARLTVLFFALAAFAQKANVKATLATPWKEAGKHPSPNAGWPEAAVAGALDLRLGGPVIRDGVMHEHPTFGDGRAELNAEDLTNALQLYRWLCTWLVGFMLLLVVL